MKCVFDMKEYKNVIHFFARWHKTLKVFFVRDEQIFPSKTKIIDYIPLVSSVQLVTNILQ